jgi:apolipoprotein N-acyltransferase
MLNRLVFLVRIIGMWWAAESIVRIGVWGFFYECGGLCWVCC